MPSRSKPRPSQITAGEVQITLDDEDLVLKPTLRAMTQISRTYGGLAKARTELVAENVDAVAYIIRVGSGMNDRDAKDLAERVWRNGITGELLVPLINFVNILGNGGKPLNADDDDDDHSGDASEGHGLGNV